MKQVKFAVSENFLGIAWEEDLKFAMLMNPGDLQNWFDYGQSGVPPLLDP